jgi:regulator of cell morphogenesis and NO signaling
MTITESTTISDIAAAVPSSTRVFQQHSIDFCCGGKRTIGEVCRVLGVPFAELASAIEISASHPAADERDWMRQPLHALIDHIVATYHDRLREDLPRIEMLASKVLNAHGLKVPFLARLEDIVGELSADLNDHMRKEETVLFPAIRAAESGERGHAMWFSGPITVMEQEHDRAGALLAELRHITSGYRRGEWACQSVRALYLELEELERSMHLHVHLENNVLFPRALKLAQNVSVARGH